MTNSLPFRQIHLDFHTSEHISEVGESFDADFFVKTLKNASVNSVTCFARCHHGWGYYPSKFIKQHPHLKRDLLGEMVKACSENGIATPIYITVQWDEFIAREHPEWRVMHANNNTQTQGGNIAANQEEAGWHTICLSNQGYIDYIIAQTKEIMELYNPPGLFYDINILWECVCPNCISLMKKNELDVNSAEDRLSNHKFIIADFFEQVSSVVNSINSETRIFFNNGHIAKGEREVWKNFSHFELESLPTGGWGYDHFPVSARYVEPLGREFLGMTGKFHTSWGEFGGFKRSVALEYETALMVALGAKCSIGDQLHPSGGIDADTYKSIAPAYKRIEKLEPYLSAVNSNAKLAILSAEAILHKRGEFESADMGAARVLLELHQMFDIIDFESDFDKYSLIIMPDFICVDEKLKVKLNNYLSQGGKLILSGTSGMNLEQESFAIPFQAQVKGVSSYNPDYIKVVKSLDSELPHSPFVIYDSAQKVKSTGAEVLAESHLPYFNRDWQHFCSHQHAPFRPEANLEYDAVLQDGNIIYFSHKIFLSYYNLGQPLFKYLVRGALKRLVGAFDIEVKNLPSAGRVSLMEQKRNKRFMLHLLYAQPQLRGESVFGWTSANGDQKIEIIEDVVPVYNLECSIALPSEVRGVMTSNGVELPFSYELGRLKFGLEKLYIHEVIIIQY